MNRFLIALWFIPFVLVVSIVWRFSHCEWNRPYSGGCPNDRPADYPRSRNDKL